MWGALLSLAGGAISTAASSKQSRRNYLLTRQQMINQTRQFNAQMDESIQRRVRDAEKAGVHPLFALGASVGATPTASIGGGSPVTGSAFGRALGRVGLSLAEAELQSRSASAKRDEAEAALLDARRKVVEQELSATGRDTFAEIQVMPKSPRSWHEQIAAHRRNRSGVPLYIDVQDQRTGQPMRLFNPALGLDEVGQVLYLNEQGKADRNAVILWLENKLRALDKGVEQRLGKYEWFRKTQRFVEGADARVRELVNQIGEKL